MSHAAANTASSTLVVTLIGDDRPGIVERVSAVISSHDGNWLESSMAHLAGKFAGVVRLDVPAAQAAALESALVGLAGLKVTVEKAATEKSALVTRRLKLALVGHDRIGIIREVSQVLARHAVNVEELETYTSSAPMSAEIMFHARIELQAGPDLDAAALTTDLEHISNDLMVDINLDETT